MQRSAFSFKWLILRPNSIEKSATTSSEAVLELSSVAALQLIEVPWLSTALNMLFPDRWEEAEVYIQFFRCQSTLTPLCLVNLA